MKTCMENARNQMQALRLTIAVLDEAQSRLSADWNRVIEKDYYAELKEKMRAQRERREKK